MAEIARGHTSDRPFVRTIYTIAAKRFTGDLSLDHDGSVSTLAWHRGFIVAAAVPGVDGTLGERASAMFGITDATYVLTDSSTLASAPDDQPVDPRWLIFHGVLAHYDNERLERETAMLAHRPIQVKADALQSIEHFGFEPQDEQLVKRMMSQPWTLNDLIDEGGPERRVRAVVYALLATDSLHLEGEARTQAAVRAPTPAPKPAPEPARTKPVSIDTSDRSVTGPQDLRSLLAAKVQLMERKADHFEMLDLPTNTSAQKIREVYYELAKQLHPDRIAQLNLGTLAGPASQVFARLNQAFAVLGDDAKRKQYTKALETGGGKEVDAATEAEMLRLFDAEEKFKLGEMAMRRSHFHQALEDFDQAVELNPSEGEHHAMAAYARFMDSRDKQAIAPQVKRQFRDAIRLAPQNPECLYYRGKVAKELHDFDAALYCFERALELEPKHEPAFREKKIVLELIAHQQATTRPKRRSTFFDIIKKSDG